MPTPRGPGTGKRGRRPDASGDASRFEELRSEHAGTSEDPLLLATLRLQVPKNLWTGPFSSRHPAVRLEVINRTDVTPDVSVSDYWVSGRPPGVWAGEIASFPDVVRVEGLTELGDGSIYRVTYRNPPVIYLYRRLRLPLQFPLRIQAGVITWEVVARRAEFDQVMEYVRSGGIGVTVVSIRRRPLRSHLPLLTDAQQSLLTQAMAAGYFAVPRGITLTDLAKRLGRSKSAVSEAIALIEKKLLESVLSERSLVG